MPPCWKVGTVAAAELPYITCPPATAIKIGPAPLYQALFSLLISAPIPVKNFIWEQVTPRGLLFLPKQTFQVAPL